MKKNSSNISIREYARMLNISHTAVANAIKAGKINKGVSYKSQNRKGVSVLVPELIVSIADREWGNLFKTEKLKPGQKASKLFNKSFQTETTKSGIRKIKNLPVDTGGEDYEDEEHLLSSMPITRNMSFAEAARGRELIGLALDKMRLQELEGTLVRKDVVDKALFAIGSELKKALFNIPARVTADVRAAANEVQAQMIFTVELTAILTAFSKKIDHRPTTPIL